MPTCEAGINRHVAPECDPVSSPGVQTEVVTQEKALVQLQKGRPESWQADGSLLRLLRTMGKPAL